MPDSTHKSIIIVLIEAKTPPYSLEIKLKWKIDVTIRAKGPKMNASDERNRVSERRVEG